MSQYDNTNRGSIWKNDRKESDRHPDFKGSLNVEGVEYWVSAWRRGENDNPKAPALKFSITAKDQAHNQGVSNAKAAASGGAPEYWDDVPF